MTTHMHIQRESDRGTCICVFQTQGREACCPSRWPTGYAPHRCYEQTWLGKLWILVTGSMESRADRQHRTEERWLLDRLIPKIHRIVVLLLSTQTMLLPHPQRDNLLISVIFLSWCFFQGMSTRWLRRTKEGQKVQREIAMRLILSYLRSDLQKN